VADAARPFGMYADEGSLLAPATDFLDTWPDSSQHGWCFYEPIREGDWPRLARSLAASLETGQPIDETVRKQFGWSPRQGLWRWLRGVWRTNVPTRGKR
jgi:hypothetical protein